MNKVIIIPLVIHHSLIQFKESLQHKINISGQIHLNAYRRLSALINNNVFQLAELKDTINIISYSHSINDTQSIFMLYKVSTKDLFVIDIDELTIKSSDYFDLGQIRIQGKCKGNFTFKHVRISSSKAIMISCPKEDLEELLKMNMLYLSLLSEEDIESIYIWKD